MTDRVQQMLDAVKDNFEAATKKPRLRRPRRGAGASMRAEVREGILKHPYLPSGTAPRARGLQETQTGFSGPRHPDVWRDAPVRTAGQGSHRGSAQNIDPADAALAAFRDAKKRKKVRGGAVNAPEGLSFDRPRMDESSLGRRGGRSRSGNIRGGRSADRITVDSRSDLESDEKPSVKRRGGWIGGLFGSGKRR